MKIIYAQEIREAQPVQIIRRSRDVQTVVLVATVVAKQVFQNEARGAKSVGIIMYFLFDFIFGL